MVIDWTKPISDVPDELVEKFKIGGRSVLHALGFKPRMYETKLGRPVSTGLCDCCGATNYTVPGYTDKNLRFKGFAPFLSEKQMKETNYRSSCGDDKLEEFNIKRKEFSYTDPETNETIYYTIAIQGEIDGVVIEGGDDDDF